MSEYQPYADLSDSPVLSAYAQQTINQLDPPCTMTFTKC